MSVKRKKQPQTARPARSAGATRPKATAPTRSSSARKPARTRSQPKPRREKQRAEPPPSEPKASAEPKASRPTRRKRRPGKSAVSAKTVVLKLPTVSPPPSPVLPDPAEMYGVQDPEIDVAETHELGIGSRIVPPDMHFDPELVPPSEPPPAVTSTTGPAELEAQIRALEARLDGLIRRATPPSESVAAPSLREQVEHAALEVVDRVAPHAASALEGAAHSVAGDYVERQWGREALRSRLEEVDDFGLDPTFEAKVRPALDLLYRRYFRIQVEGIEQVPRSGRAVIVANHGGTLPLDGAMLRAAMRLEHPNARDLRWLAEDFVFYLPFAGVFLNRIGAVRACPENAERLLDKDALIAVFPEGIQGVKKLFRDRYQLQRFGRGGYIRLCLRMRAPLVPCAIIGAEETNPLLYRLESFAQLWRLPYLPITPTFPLLGPLGLLPAPTRWKLRFGDPISFDNYGPEAADDDVLVGRLSERVRAAIQGLLDSGLRQRRSVWFG